MLFKQYIIFFPFQKAQTYFFSGPGPRTAGRRLCAVRAFWADGLFVTAHETHTACDKHGFVLETVITPRKCCIKEAL